MCIIYSWKFFPYKWQHDLTKMTSRPIWSLFRKLLLWIGLGQKNDVGERFSGFSPKSPCLRHVLLMKCAIEMQFCYGLSCPVFRCPHYFSGGQSQVSVLNCCVNMCKVDASSQIVFTHGSLKGLKFLFNWIFSVHRSDRKIGSLPTRLSSAFECQSCLCCSPKPFPFSEWAWSS